MGVAIIYRCHYQQRELISDVQVTSNPPYKIINHPHSNFILNSRLDMQYIWSTYKAIDQKTDLYKEEIPFFLGRILNNLQFIGLPNGPKNSRLLELQLWTTYGLPC